MPTPKDRRYVLGFGDDTDLVARADRVRVVKRLPMVVLVETDVRNAVALARTGGYVAVFRSETEGLRAFGVFEPRT